MTARVTTLIVTAAVILAGAWAVSAWLDHALTVSIGGVR